MGIERKGLVEENPSGYIASFLDGIWLRAPYLHNGSVPTLHDLLEPIEKRPTVFYRGYDVYDQSKVGFVTSGLLARRDESDLGLVIDIVASVKHRGPLLDRFEQVMEGGHRAVVQVRRPEPDAVEERCDVPAWVLLHQAFSLDAHGPDHLVCLNGRCLAL